MALITFPDVENCKRAERTMRNAVLVGKDNAVVILAPPEELVILDFEGVRYTTVQEPELEGLLSPGEMALYKSKQEKSDAKDKLPPYGYQPVRFLVDSGKLYLAATIISSFDTLEMRVKRKKGAKCAWFTLYAHKKSVQDLAAELSANEVSGYDPLHIIYVERDPGT